MSSIPNFPAYTEKEIDQLVRSFYKKARKDPSLGPIFEAHVNNWEEHFVQMTDFWSGNLLGTNRFNGAPMPKHLAIPNLRPELFEQWLRLFKQTTEELDDEGEGEESESQSGDRTDEDDLDDMTLSLAAMESAVYEDVMSQIAVIEKMFKKYATLQDKKVAAAAKAKTLSASQESELAEMKIQ